MTEIFKTTALADELGWFFVAALKGQMHEYKKDTQSSPIGSQETPISLGLSEEYSPQDIAHFYLARELGYDWQERLVDNLSDDFRRKVNVAFEEFQKDSQLEIEHYRGSLLKQNN